MAIQWHHSGSQDELAPIFGLRKVNIHAVINDTSGQLQREVFRAFKMIRKLERKRANVLRREKAWFLKLWRTWYRDNQQYMRRAGGDPGLPTLKGPQP